MTDVPIRVTLARHFAEMYLGDMRHLAVPMAAKAEALYLAASEDLDRDNQRLRAELETITAVARSNKRHTEAMAQEQERVAAELIERGAEIVRLRDELDDANRARRLAQSLERAAGWRDYTFEATNDGVAVLCRTDHDCMEAQMNETGRYLTLGEAYDWARGHIAWHAKMEEA